ncbi:MAG: ABC transporter substrate-binding protein [Gammaproteobacteria bacterium]
MKRLINLILTFCVLATLISSCSEKEQTKTQLIVGTSADYPPFEFKRGEEFQGLDIDLAKLLGKQLKKKIIFKDLAFSNLFTALNVGQIDLVISTVTFTEERNKYFDLSDPYYFTDLAIIFRKDQPIQKVSELYNKKVGAQLGSTMEMWVKDFFKDAKKDVQLVSMDLNTQLIEGLKSRQLDSIIIEHVQAIEFCKKNKELGYLVAAKSNRGYVIAMKKASKLLKPVNAALAFIKKQGDLDVLANKWLEVIVETEIHDAN